MDSHHILSAAGQFNCPRSTTLKGNMSGADNTLLGSNKTVPPRHNNLLICDVIVLKLKQNYILQIFCRERRREVGVREVQWVRVSGKNREISTKYLFIGVPFSVINCSLSLKGTLNTCMYLSTARDIFWIFDSKVLLMRKLTHERKPRKLQPKSS